MCTVGRHFARLYVVDDATTFNASDIASHIALLVPCRVRGVSMFITAIEVCPDPDHVDVTGLSWSVRDFIMIKPDWPSLPNLQFEHFE
jgi:hypothetical protein